MPGFNNTPPASEFRNPTSWGRTRQPKNVAGAHGTVVTDVAALPDPATYSAPSPSNGIYATENQRFVHVSAASTGALVNIWVFSYASGIWAELVDDSGNAHTVAGGKTRIFEIDGVDLIAFNVTNSVYAACSTF